MIRAYKTEDFSLVLKVIADANVVDRAGLSADGDLLVHQLATSGDGQVVVAEVDGNVVGYARLETREDRQGRLEALCFGAVTPTYRGQLIGHSLLGWAKKRATELGAVLLLVPVRHSIKGLQQLVEAAGFTPRNYYFVLKYAGDIAGHARVEAPLGVSIRTYQGLADIPTISQGLSTCFGGEFTLPAVDGPEFVSDLWLIAEHNGELAGICIGGISQEQGEITYLGVLPAYRGQGIAKSLLSEQLCRLRQRQQKLITLAVNTTNVNAISLYQSVGFEEWRRSTTFQFTLE